MRLHPVDHLVVVADRERHAEHLGALGRRSGGAGALADVGAAVGGDCVKIPALVAIDPDFWRGRRVLVTGHTGFKGAWLSLWLQSLGPR